MRLRNHYVLPFDAAVELRAFTHGLMPRTVPAMMHRFTRDWQTRGVDAWNEVPNHWCPDRDERVGWWTLPTYLGDRFVAPLLGAPEGTCILQPNAHWTVSALLSAPEVWARGDEMVVSALDFPSVLHTARRWADVFGYRLRVVPPAEDGFVDREGVLAAIGERTALVMVSHVGFTTGERLPDDVLATIGERAHAHGALFGVDGYHAAATMPVDVAALGVDVYVGGLLKEASGSSGNAFVYLRPGLELTPRLTGWFGDADPFAFGEAPTPHPDVRSRFRGGTPAVASMYHAVEGVRLLLGAGLEAVRADSLDKTSYCIRRAAELGLSLRSPEEDERRGAMVIFEIEAADRLCAHLKTQGIYTDSRRGHLLRLAPFVWNTRRDLKRAFAAIEDALASGAHLDAPLPDEAGPVT